MAQSLRYSYAMSSVWATHLTHKQNCEYAKFSNILDLYMVSGYSFTRTELLGTHVGFIRIYFGPIRSNEC